MNCSAFFVSGAVSKETISTKTTTPPAIRPSRVWNGMEDMEESVEPQALFLCDYSMFCTIS